MIDPEISGFLLVEGINDAIFFSAMLDYLDLGNSVRVAQMIGIDKLNANLETQKEQTTSFNQAKLVSLAPISHKIFCLT